MTDRDRMQVYLEMSKESTRNFLEWYGSESGEPMVVRDDEVLECWNSHFRSVCRKLGVKP